MNKRLFRKIALTAATVFLLLVMVLGIHIYVVTRPQPPDAHTIIMARIDIKQNINQADADKITACLYQQKGVNHVLVNPEGKIAIFTFFPLQNSGDNIVKSFKATSGYKAERYLPSKEELKSGCPVSSNSVSGKLTAYLKNVF